MSKKAHLYFKNPIEGKTTFKQKTRYSGKDGEEKEGKDIPNINIEALRNSVFFYNQGKSNREENRNKELNISLFIDYIEIEFYDTFSTKDFISQYRTGFGIYPVVFSQFNTVGLFAVVDYNLFEKFFAELNRITTEKIESNYNPNIKFIKAFRYYDVGVFSKGVEAKFHYILELIDNSELFQDIILPLEKQLMDYLSQKKIRYTPDLKNNRIELLDVSVDIVQEIANNFDIIQGVNSHDSGFIRPSLVQTPIRSFGFEIAKPEENLPVIGIIDSGISNLTPLKELIINQENEFDITGGSPLEDTCNHGTGVAALAIFGDKLYVTSKTSIKPDAKVLSIKVTNTSTIGLTNKDVLDLICQANNKYGIKLFNLCVGYTDSKKENSLIDHYAYLLDCLAYELDVLIFISAGNNCGLFFSPDDGQVIHYPEQFKMDSAIIKTPAESMNNITVGAASGNLEIRFDAARSISPDKDAPAYYTCRHHIKTKLKNQNKQLSKPDIIHYGGDYDHRLAPSDLGIKLISSEIGEFYKREVGTSYSTPLACNLAARLLKIYPNLYRNMQTVKALIINSASSQPYISGFINKTKIYEPHHLIGKGIPNAEDCIYSNENSVTLVLEESIQADDLLVFPIRLPGYLNALSKRSVLEITATLCFKFKPIPNSHLSYCPIHIAFGLFRNLAFEEKSIENIDGIEKTINIGINGNNTKRIKLTSSSESSWSEDYYFKSKPLSNVQKIAFSVSKKHLISENGTFKIAVSSRFNKLLTEEEKRSYNHEHAFSIVINIKEKGKSGSGRLYEGLCAINDLEIINKLEMETEARAQLDLFSEI